MWNKNSQPFEKKCQKTPETPGGFDSHCIGLHLQLLLYRCPKAESNIVTGSPSLTIMATCIV